MTDTEILERMSLYSRNERKHQAEWLRHLGLVEEKRLYALAGYQDMWTYVEKGLFYAATSVGKRLQVARTARKFPVIYQLIADCRLTMTAVSRLSPHLTESNHLLFLEKCAGKTVSQVEEIIAAAAPRPDVRDSVRAVAGNPTEQAELCVTPAAPEKPKAKEKIKPIAESRYHVNFTIGKETRDKQKRLEAVACNKFTMEQVYQAGLEALLKQQDPDLKKPRKAAPPKKHTRYIPQNIKREVRKRDGERCTYLAPDGRRCEATTRLQFDHAQSWGMGGSSHDARNIRLTCRAHNLWFATQAYGAKFMQAKMRVSS